MQGLLERIKKILWTQPEVQDFKDELKKKYGLSKFLLATNEGLPVMSTFSKHEELAAKIPELIKVLSEFEKSKYYLVSTGTTSYLIMHISENVLFFAKYDGNLNPNRIHYLKQRIQEELGL